jgi:M6 family metalloprotease-like protein
MTSARNIETGRKVMRWTLIILLALSFGHPGLRLLLNTAYAQAPSAGGRPSCANPLRPLVIQVEFPDIGRKIDTPFVRRKFLKEPDRYIREMSYGKVCLAGEITRKWYRMPSSMERYWVPGQNLKVDKENLRRLVADTLRQVERDTDVARNDFVILALAATAKDWGNQGLNVYPGLLGIKDDSALLTPGGRKIKGGIAVYAQSANLAKVFHNIAHIIGGVKDGRRVLPDMYDQDTASSSKEEIGPRVLAALIRAQMHMGAWDPMSCNVCRQLPDAPGVTSWTRLRLGWLSESKVRTISPGEHVEVRLGPLADAASSTLAVRIPLTKTTHYLLENRQRIGQDKNLPGTGVLIMYSDDDNPEPRFGRAPVRLVNADPSVPHLDGAAFEIGKNAAFSDPANGVEVRLLRKAGNSYDIRITRK